MQCVNRSSNYVNLKTRPSGSSINCEGPKTADRAVYRLVKAAAEDLGVDPGSPNRRLNGSEARSDCTNSCESITMGSSSSSMRSICSKGRIREAEYNSLIIYQLSRARKLADFDGPISLTTITNYADFMKDLNSRAQSSYNPDDIFFDDYDANQLRSILRNRQDAFKPDSLADDVVPLVAAFGSQTHGDARKAIDLLRWAGELAERRGATRLSRLMSVMLRRNTPKTASSATSAAFRLKRNSLSTPWRRRPTTQENILSGSLLDLRQDVPIHC